jgi:hypothetical protein
MELNDTNILGITVLILIFFLFDLYLNKSKKVQMTEITHNIRIMLLAVFVDQTTAFISGFFVNDAIIPNALERHLTSVLIMRNRSHSSKKR